MSDLNSYYDNFPEDRKERKKRNKIFYSSKDFIPGAKGVFVKLFVSFTIFLMSTSFIAFIMTHFMPVTDMLFLAAFSSVMMLVSWSVSILLKEKINILRLLPVIIFSAGAYWISPYGALLTAAVLAYNMIISFVTISRLRLPERLTLTQPLLLVSCLFFCFYQIVSIMNPNITETAMEARGLFMSVGVSWIIVCIFALNLLSLSKVAPGQKLAKGLLTGNIAMTVLFAGLILIISNVGAYKDFIIGIVRKIFSLLFGGSEPEEVPLESQAPQGGGMDLSELVGESKSSVFWEFMDKLFFILLFVLLAVLLFYIVKKLIKVFSALIRRAMSYLGGSSTSEAILSFEDKEESIFDRTQFNEVLKNRWGKFRKRFERKPKFADLQSNREKVRYIYKRILKNNEKEEKPVSKDMTAREYFSEKSELYENIEFVHGYEKARYSVHDVKDDEVAAGLNVTGKLK